MADEMDCKLFRGGGYWNKASFLNLVGNSFDAICSHRFNLSQVFVEVIKFGGHFFILVLLIIKKKVNFFD